MIIDTHVHIGKCLNFDMTEEQVLNAMEKCNISLSIVSNATAAEFDHELNPIPKELQTSQIDSFADAISFARRNPTKIAIMPWIKPYGETADSSFEKMIADNLDIVCGIKAHPYHSTVAFDSDKMIPYVKLAQKYNLPMVSHTGGSDAASCQRVYNMAKRFPDVRFVMVHMGLGTDNTEAIELLSQLDNLYGDTTWVPMTSTLAAIKKAGNHKIMFGSDMPIDGEDTYICNPRGERSLYQDYFHKLKDVVGEECYQRIMYKNAIGIFGDKLLNIINSANK